MSEPPAGDRVGDERGAGQPQLTADDFAQQLAREGGPDSATAWFDRLYAASEQGRAVIPWDRGQAHPLLIEWLERCAPPARGTPALVVGSGPGHDAELLAARGFATTAFDVSPTAVAATRARFPDSTVDYLAADLLALPTAWQRAFGLVVEIFTVQSLPRSLREQATAAICATVAPGGTLLVVQAVSDDAENDVVGPPWPLTAAEIAAFGRDGLVPVNVEELGEPHRWRAEFRRA